MLAINKRQLIFLLFLGLVSLGISIALTLFLGQRQNGNVLGGETAAVENYPQAQVPQVQDLKDLKSLNILLLGYGGAGHDGGYLTDVIQVLHIDFAKPKLQLISIPRDLWVILPNGETSKINQGFTNGGQTSKVMAEVVTGLKIDYFIAIDFVNFQRAVGEFLDGIEVEIPETLDDPWYPIKGEELNTCGMTPEELAEVHSKYSGFELERQFECRYEHLHFEKGSMQLEGGDALKYVRSRHGSSAGDFSRSQRQAVVLEGIRKKLLSLKALDDSIKFFENASKLISTDIDVQAVEYLTPALKAISTTQLQSLVLSTDNVFINGRSTDGQFILLPKEGQDTWDAVHNLVEKELQ